MNLIKKYKFSLLCLLAVLLLLSSARLYYRLTDDFRISNITYTLPFEAPWKPEKLSKTDYEELAHILDQKFTYLGKGAQSYAFASADGQYVIKFFKFKHLKPNFLIDLLPSVFPFKNYKAQTTERKKRKLITAFNGYQIAYEKNRQHAALVYIHLVPTNDLNLHLTLIDKMGWQQFVNLDEIVFIVQKKGITLRAKLHELLKEQKIEEAKQAIQSMLAMYLNEYAKGIYDHDHGIMQNTGFIGKEPFHLDSGKVLNDESMKEKSVYKEDLAQVMWNIHLWFQSNYPDISPVFSQFLENYYQLYLEEPLNLNAINPQRFKDKRHQTISSLMPPFSDSPGLPS